jgi:uncharacterized alkaline shock family protein YloU
MMDNELRLGRIEVAPEAIATIAGRAVLGCYGVVGMSAKTLRDGLAILLQQENPYRGVEVEFVDRYKIIIDLYVVIEYGVKFAVEKALGLPVVQVNVHVQGLHVSDAD